MRRLLKISLILLPVFVIPLTINKIHINIRDARELLFQSLAIIALGIVIKNRWIKWFLYWVVANWWLNYFLPPQSTAVLFNVTFGFLFFYLIKEFIRLEDIDGILKIVCFTALFQVLWLGIQQLGLDPVFNPITPCGDELPRNFTALSNFFNSRIPQGIRNLMPNMNFKRPPIIGFLGNKNLLGAYLAFCVPLFRVYFKKLIPLIFIGLLVARSSTALVAALGGLIVFELFMVFYLKDIIRFKRLGIIILVCIISFVLFFLFIDKFELTRLTIWKKLIVQTLNWRILIGQGLGRYQVLRVIDKTGTPWDNPHNEYLQIYFELGIIGLIFIFGYLVSLFKRFFKYRTKETILLFSCCVVVLIECIGMFPFQIAPLAFLGIVYFALLERVLCQNHQAILSMN